MLIFDAKNIIMKKIVVVLLLLSFGFSQAQKAKFKWGEFDKLKGLPNSNILVLGDDEFFDLNFKPQTFALTYSMIKYFPIVRYFKKNKMVKELKFEGTAPGKNESYEYFELIGGKAYMFSTTREKDVTGFFAYEIDKSLKVGKPKKLMSHKKETKETFDFTLEVSEDGSYFAVLIGMEDKKTDTEKFEYVIFNSDFELVSKGKYKLPYPRKECDIAQHHISNSGEYFVAYKVYETNAKGKVKDMTKLKKYVIRQLSEDDTEDYEIKPKKGSVKDVVFKSNNQKTLTLTGLWGSETRAIQGVFNMIVDFKRKEITSESFEDFDKKFILNAWPEKAKEKYEKKQEKGKNKGKTEPALTNYVFRNMIPQKDGGSVVLMEQSYIIVRTTTDSKGNTRTTYYYHENGVIAYKIEADGTIGWKTYVNKEQVTTNDGGFAISFGYLNDDNQVMLFFHDNKKNYTEKGKYNNERIRMNFNKKHYCFAQASIDTKTGEVSRSIVHDFKEAGGFVLPKYIRRNSDPSMGVAVMVKKFRVTTKRYGSVSI